MIQFSKYGYGQGNLPGRTIDDREIKNEKIFIWHGMAGISGKIKACKINFLPDEIIQHSPKISMFWGTLRL